MLSSDKNVETIAQLIEVLKGYIGLQKEYLKLNVIEKFVRLFTALTLAIVLVILGIAVLFYLSFATVHWIEPVVGTGWAFAIVSAFFLLVLVTAVLLRKPLIERPLVKFLTETLMNS